MDKVRQLRRLLPRKRPVLFLCIGTDRATGDALGPLVGDRLKEKGLLVLGTLDEPVHAVNLADTVQLIQEQYPNHFVVAIDASLGQYKSIGSINIRKGPLEPGSGVGKDLPTVGDAHITGVVNVGGFLEYFVLQNTRLSFVMKMADEIAHICAEAVRHRRRKWAFLEVAAAK